MAKPKKKPASGQNPKVYTFNLSLGAMASIAVAGAAVLTAFFALGVLVGRGYQPEEAVPRLAQFMGKVIPANQTKEPEPEVLKPEELGFRERLTKDSPEEARPKKNKEEAKAKPAETQKPKAKPAAANEAAAEPAAKAIAAQQREAAAPAAANDPVFDYVYQAAAFTELQRALKLQDDIRAAGLTPSIQQAQVKETTWYRVMVLFQGRPSDTRNMKDKLAGIGIKKPIMKSKKPL